MRATFERRKLNFVQQNNSGKVTLNSLKLRLISAGMEPLVQNASIHLTEFGQQKLFEELVDLARNYNVEPISNQIDITKILQMCQHFRGASAARFSIIVN